MSTTSARFSDASPREGTIRLFLCGDVMTGRGIDQVLPAPCDPILYEGHVRSARDYVHLAEKANGPISAPMEPALVWGMALDECDRARPHLRIINLETAITRSGDHVPKGINYRMSPENASCLAAFGVDCCVLANNHILDWGPAGLFDTLTTLDRLRLVAAGAGRDADEAGEPAVLDVRAEGRVLLFAFATPTSGVPPSWAAEEGRPGVNFLPSLDPVRASCLAEHIRNTKRPQDIVVVSVHWGPNWGYEVPAAQRRFAHALIDEADVSIVHGHSSHHPKAIEVYRNRLILYGCGDFINDYEGISGYAEFRSDLRLMYFADIDRANGDLSALNIVPLRAHRFSLVCPSGRDLEWVSEMLARESRRFGTVLERGPDGRLNLR
ncbi:poly-gamma-glutamate biosynthesis protein [Sinorhizobium glycinis]|uniref:Poly-gamma-glutamate biosynthesis protein n=1 Tax=Sinorhizobium glycinis TaxID=1472378 RepID=A0A178XX54_9HYPH|nr:CapA family protein [Sinorhizobium glycinis]OAP39909.1 poly-gamma-glutamate biosynthesis protein [Sinorhizobium glycinis]